MKKIIFGLFIIITVQQIAFSQSGWIQQTSGTNIALYSVFFSDTSNGYVCGYDNYLGYSIILKTTNGGTNWILIQSYSYPFILFLGTIYFLNKDTGYCTGDSPHGAPILKTVNGGINWDTTIINNSNMLFSIAFLNNNTGFIVGKYGVMMQTSNGGVNWISSQLSPYDLNSIFFVNSGTGFTVGGPGGPGGNNLILKTTNSGLNWVDCSPSFSNYYLMSVHFPSLNTGYVCGHFGILKTTNSGLNWVPIYQTQYQWLLSTYFTSENTGFVVGGLLLKTTNGGINFTDQTSIQNINLNSVFFINQNTGWTVGQNGTILKTTTGGEPIGIKSISNGIPNKFYLYQNYPNPFNPTTKIKFDIPNLPLMKGVGGMDVHLTIYDLLGREIATLVNEQLKPGSYEAEWDGSNFASGIYFYTLKTDNFSRTRKMILLK